MAGDDDRPIREDPAGGRDDRPSHPNRQAMYLLIGVTVLIVVLAYLSSTGSL